MPWLRLRKHELSVTLALHLHAFSNLEFLGIRIALQMRDALFLELDLVLEVGVLFFEDADLAVLFAQCIKPLRPAQHDGSIGADSRQHSDKSDGTQQRTEHE